MDKILYEIFSKIENLCNFAQGYMESFQEKTTNEQKTSKKTILLDKKVIKRWHKKDTSNQGEFMPPKLKYGQGSILKRTKTTKKGIYSYYQGTIQYNNQRHTVTAKTQNECFNKLKELRLELSNKIAKPKTTILTLGKWLERWYVDYKQEVLKPNSLKNIKVILNRHIPELLKNKAINKLKPIDIQECLNNETSSRQREEIVKVLRNAFKFAKINGLVKENICDNLIIKKHQYISAKALDKAEQKLLIDNAPEDLKKCIIGYLWTGCRRNELLSIKKEDCNITEMTITIKGTKTETSYRTIPLFTPLLKFIEETKDNDFVFKCSCINKKFKLVCDSLNFENVTIHSLRHTFATICIEKNVNLKSVQHWLGHSRMSTTTDIYTHLNKDQEAIDTKKMDD